MIPTNFPEANCTFGKPNEMEDSECGPIRTFAGDIKSGPFDGYRVIVTAWRPSPQELADLFAGAPVYLACIGGLPPHVLTTSFKAACLGAET